MTFFRILMIGLVLSAATGAYAADDDLALPDAGTPNNASPDPSMPPTLPEESPAEDPTDVPPTPISPRSEAPSRNEQPRRSRGRYDNDAPTGKMKGYVESPLLFGLDLAYSRTYLANYRLGRDGSTPGVVDTISIRFEWLPLTTVGKLGIGLTTGFGRASNQPLADGTFASLYVVPIEAALTYRADFFHHQILVPYLRAGLDATLFKQTSGTGSAQPLRAGRGKVLGAGLEINLGFFEPAASKQLDISVGVNETFLFAEYVSAKADDPEKAPDLTRHEIRAGLRLEF